MSGFDTVEDMDIDGNDDMNQASAQSKIQQHPAAADKPAADEDEALIVLSLKWINPDEPQKLKRPESCLQKMFQSWFNKCKPKVDCSVQNILPDRSVVIKTEPAPAITELQRLSQQTLTGRDGSSVTVTSVSLTLPPSQLDTQTPAEASMNLPSLPQTDEDEALIVLSLKWINPDEPQKIKRPESRLEKMLQSWFDKCKRKPDCSVENILPDRSVVIKINPAPAVTELQRLSRQTLTGRDGSSVTVTSVSLPPPGSDTQTPADASMNLPPSLPQTEQVQPEKRSNAASAAGEMISCPVPVGLFWYVKHMYEEELKRIEEVNGVKIRTEVKFEVDQKDGNPDKALDEFTDLMQTCMTEFSGSVIPLKFKDPDQSRDALKTIQTKENKLLVTLTSEGMSVCGPKHSQDVIRKLLCGDAHQKRKPSSSVEEYEREIEDTSVKIKLTTQDRLPDGGLIMEESDWKLMSTSYNEQVKRIKDKFNVELKDSNISQDKVNVKAFYKKGGGNASMESHALTALLRLYQKITSSPMNFSQFPGASRSLMNTDVHQSGGASNGPVLNGQSANRKHNTDAPHGGGATAGDGEEEKCPICLDEFKNKKRLKCTHEFCEECLQQAEDASGPTCPVCRVVFGKIIGDQPDGKMSHRILYFSLSGFPRCNTIVIDYEIPNGKQTERHPNPGQHFSGISRSAFLPDNTEGNEVLQLLKRAFDQRLIFTVGTSRTTGMDDQVTWNDIHHKTSTTGGPQSFGYPDPEYLSRVKEELKAKGIE